MACLRNTKPENNPYSTIQIDFFFRSGCNFNVEKFNEYLNITLERDNIKIINATFLCLEREGCIVRTDSKLKIDDDVYSFDIKFPFLSIHRNGGLYRSGHKIDNDSVTEILGMDKDFDLKDLTLYGDFYGKDKEIPDLKKEENWN